VKILSSSAAVKGNETPKTTGSKITSGKVGE